MTRTFHVALKKPVDFCTSTSSTVQQTFFRVSDSEHGVHAAPTKRHLLQANGMKASESYEPKIEKLHGPYLSILVSSYLYLSIYLSVYLSIYLSMDRSIYHFSNWSTHHSSGSRIYLDLSIYLSIGHSRLRLARISIPDFLQPNHVLMGQLVVGVAVAMRPPHEE